MTVARSTPAFENNHQPIAEVLARWLPREGRALEIASGPGAHAAFFARRFPGLTWQPSDIDPMALDSIRAWVAQHDHHNLLEPIAIDVAEPWPLPGPFDAVVNINMLHVSEFPRVADGLFGGAARVLPAGAPLLIYGPFIRAEVETAPSNLRFDQHLRARNSAWGLRHVEAVEERARAAGLELREVVDMPANNNVLVFVS